MSTSRSKWIGSLVIVALIGLTLGWFARTPAIEALETESAVARLQSQDTQAGLDESQALNTELTVMNEALQAQLIEAEDELAQAEGRALAAEAALQLGQLLWQQVESTSGQGAGTETWIAETTSETQEESLSRSAYPELHGVIQPQSLKQFLEPHWTDHRVGDPNAPVQIVEFFSYACHFCKSFHDNAYQELLAT